jgi:cell wall-associated NlpC family hydrolase
VAWSALLGATVAVAFASPVYADPAVPNTIPDTGARPVPAAAPALPGVTAAVVGGPLAAQLAAKDNEFAALGDQLLKLRQDRDAAGTERAAAELALRAADETLAKAEAAANTAATAALKDAAGLPPGTFGSDLHGLGTLSRLQGGDPSGGDSTAAVHELARAKAARQLAYDTFVAADARAGDTASQFTAAEARHKALDAELRKLRQDNVVQLAAIQSQQNAAEQRLGAQYLNASSIAGLAADPRALAAVRYALAHLGDPYVWGAEGPHQFDCSGLVWAAYRSPGADYYDLPRVAADQYYATRTREVPPTALLPGDLVFFATNSSWTSIHHVGMYIGGGMMVQAPTTGDVVKVSPVQWSHLYAATRIFGAVPAPVAPAPPSTGRPPTGIPGPIPIPIPIPGPVPVPTPTPSPTPTPPAGPPTSTPARPPSPTAKPTSPSPAAAQSAPPPSGPTPTSTPAAR